MKQPLYIFKSGTIERAQNTIRFVDILKKSRYIPVTTTSAVHVFGEVNFNARALNFLSEHEIAVHIYDYFNRYSGSFMPRKRTCSGQLVKLHQAEYYLDNQKRLSLARSFVSGALVNIGIVLNYYYKRRKMDILKTIEKVNQAKDKLAKITSIEGLMAIEGNAREEYYKAWDVILNNPDFPFEKRTRQPPENRLNALISFGNMLLYSSALTEVYATNLDPGIGFLHSTNNRSFSLNLDVAEIFKPIIVDRMIFSLLNNKRLKANSFQMDKKNTLLTKSGKEKFLNAYHDRLKETIKLKGEDRPVSYRTLIRRECYKIEKHVSGKQVYVPFKIEE